MEHTSRRVGIERAPDTAIEAELRVGFVVDDEAAGGKQRVALGRREIETARIADSRDDVT